MNFALLFVVITDTFPFPKEQQEGIKPYMLLQNRLYPVAELAKQTTFSLLPHLPFPRFIHSHLLHYFTSFVHQYLILLAPAPAVILAVMVVAAPVEFL